MASIPHPPRFSPELGQREDTRVTELAPPRAGRLAVLVQAGNASQADDFGVTPLIPIGGGVQIGRGISLAGGGPPIDDPRVSRAHAEITRASGGYHVCDLGSTNGTFVDGLRVNEPFPIQDGSIIGIGPYVFVFRMIPRTALAAVGEELATPFGPVPTVSAEAAMIIRRLRALARVDLDLLITGETGVGKEVYARSIHRASGRQGRFLAINCAAIPETLIESELFGYAKGAHSTATDAKAGLLEEADGGTLFLDEIGDMPMPAQTKLLRFLQDRRFVPSAARARARSMFGSSPPPAAVSRRPVEIRGCASTSPRASDQNRSGSRPCATASRTSAGWSNTSWATTRSRSRSKRTSRSSFTPGPATSASWRR